MIRKNLFLIITESYDEDSAYNMHLSNYIPGCLDWDEYIKKITYIINMAYPTNIIQNLTSLRLNSKIIFDKVTDFSFNPSKYDGGIDLVDNLYIVNTTNNYISLDCTTIYIDNYYKENGYMLCPETVSCFYLTSTNDKKIEYEIKSINYKDGLYVL